MNTPWYHLRHAQPNMTGGMNASSAIQIRTEHRNSTSQKNRTCRSYDTCTPTLMCSSLERLFLATGACTTKTLIVTAEANFSPLDRSEALRQHLLNLRRPPTLDSIRADDWGSPFTRERRPPLRDVARRPTFFHDAWPIEQLLHLRLPAQLRPGRLTNPNTSMPKLRRGGLLEASSYLWVLLVFLKQVDLFVPVK